MQLYLVQVVFLHLVFSSFLFFNKMTHPILKKIEKRRKLWKEYKVILTRQQATIYDLYRKGKKQQEIADQLEIAQTQVCRQLQSVGKKIGEIKVKKYSKKGDYVIYKFKEVDLEHYFE